MCVWCYVVCVRGRGSRVCVVLCGEVQGLGVCVVLFDVGQGSVIMGVCGVI